MRVGRRRTKNKHLPRRVYFYHGRYWFMDMAGRRHDLGTTEAAMYGKLAEHIDTKKPLRTMGHVFDRYLVEVLPALAERTQADYRQYIKRLCATFQDAPPAEITPGHILDYRAARAKRSVVQANREISCLSAVFRAGLGWHVVDRNPCHELARLHEPSRDRYVTDAEYAAVYELAPPVIRCAMELAVLTGLREGDLLRLRRDNLVDDGIVVKIGKSKRRHPRHGKVIESGKTLVIEWSDELKAVVNRARRLPPPVRGALLCKRGGEAFTESGFRTAWHRLMMRATSPGAGGAPPAIAEWFTFHDLRAKSASDDELAAASARLGHEDVRMTERVYRRKPRRARPLR